MPALKIVNNEPGSSLEELLKNTKDSKVPLDLNYISPGVLNSEQTKLLAQEGVIKRYSGNPVDTAESAIDLHISADGWEMEGSIKQKSPEKKEDVESICNKYGKPLKIKTNQTLKRGSVYVFKLDEHLDFQNYPWLCGEATGKSSIGRLDVLTRLLADNQPTYESVNCRYVGPLYIEIIPLSFDVTIYPMISLNQLRIHCGEINPMDKASLVGRRLLFIENQGSKLATIAQEDGLLSLDVSNTMWGKNTAAALQLKQSPPVLDLKEKGKADPNAYFTPVESKDGRITIEPDNFYIFRSKERLLLPKDIAVTGVAYTENLGELRIHYAGFAHPWFGQGRTDGRVGTPLIYEVRAHSFPIVLRDDEKFAKIKFYKMSADIPVDEQKPGDYSDQELELSKYFRKP